MAATTRTQLRATCPACFAQQAVRNGALVQHGYRVPQHWHGHVGTCTGTGEQHFGTPAGRAYTLALANRLRAAADNAVADVRGVLEGSLPVYGTKQVAARLRQQVVIENPTAQQRARYAASLEAQAVAMRKQAAEFDKLAAAWTAKEPVAVQVADKAAGPLVHWRGGWTASRGGRKACAASMMASMACDSSSTDLKLVTCEKCKAVAARLAAKAVA
jgi:hypothetical protein